MTVFVILAAVLPAALVLVLTARRFASSIPAAEPAEERRRPAPGAYLGWLRMRLKALAVPSFFRKTWDLWNGWAEARYRGWTKWIFLAWAAAFLYLAGSGLFFAIFVRRGLYGLPLLGHVVSGGLFAAGLAAVLILRAGAHGFDRREETGPAAFAVPFVGTISRAIVRKTVFWWFAAFGFVQVTTALASMLPMFTFNTQVALLMIHRFSALGLTLAAIVFFDLILPDRAGPRA